MYLPSYMEVNTNVNNVVPKYEVNVHITLLNRIPNPTPNQLSIVMVHGVYVMD